jgi:hypothetical protein
VAQPDPRAQVEQVLGRDPRFRQPADHQQLTQVARIGAIAFGALLGPATRGGLGRLGQMHPRTDRRELLDHEPPTRRRLQRHLELQIAEALGEPPHPGAMRGSHPLA